MQRHVNLCDPQLEKLDVDRMHSCLTFVLCDDISWPSVCIFVQQWSVPEIGSDIEKEPVITVMTVLVHAAVGHAIFLLEPMRLSYQTLFLMVDYVVYQRAVRIR